jgi:hypothetical protein
LVRLQETDELGQGLHSEPVGAPVIGVLLEGPDYIAENPEEAHDRIVNDGFREDRL